MGLKLFQEAQVGFVKQPDIVDVMLEHRHPLDAESPRVSIPLRWVDAAVAQHLRMNHPATADLQPTLVPAALAAHAVADSARHVELEARLRAREVARAYAHLALLSVEGLDHVQQRSLHVADGQPFVDSKALDLAEVRKARGLG